ncbi:DNA internalization-related competence protein ComEC/Rec2 [Vibrio sp. RC27]
MILLMNYWQLGSFCLILISLPYWPMVPELFWCGLFVIYYLILFKRQSYQVIKYSLGISMGLLWGVMFANITLEQSETLYKSDTNTSIKIRAESDFAQNNFGFSGRVQITSVNGQALEWYRQPRVQLYSPVMLQRGDEGQFNAKIKPIFGLLNEAGSDSERYYFGQAILGKAYVDKRISHYVIEHMSWRKRFKQLVSLRVEPLVHSAIILALSFADRTGIDNQQWERLKSSGLSHLVAISGLHISIAFGLGYGVILMLSRVIQRGYWAALPAGVMLATSYSWLADFTLPTQRALTMLFIYVVIAKLSVQLSYVQKMLWVLTIVLLVNPLATVNSSFWLSFCAVSAVIYVMTANTHAHGVKAWVKGHLWVSLAMLPLSAIMFGGISVVSPFYNMVFIPWFSVVVVPLLFLALLVTGIGVLGDHLVWTLVDYSLAPLSYLLPYSDNAWLALSQNEIWLVSCSVFVLALRPILGGQWLMLVLLIFSSEFYRQSRHDWRVDLLDVGQGLAVLIEQDGHYLLYDTGSGWNDSSMVDLVITPVLEKRGVDQLDILVLSHLDNDHAGGRWQVEQRWRPRRRIASANLAGYSTCIQGQKWQWQRLDIEVLWPPKTPMNSRNEFSCVLKISGQNGVHSVLLTGDIGVMSEWLLVKQLDDAQWDLMSDIIVVPHHGSATSSSSQFIQMVQPSLALAGLAKGNRWNFPNSKVKQRYTESGARWLDSGDAGQVSVRFNKDDFVVRYQRSRDSVFHYQSWYRQMLRKQVE